MNADKQQLPTTINDGMGTMNKIAYRDGSIHRDNWETEPQVENQFANQGNFAVRGLLFGMTIAVLLGLISGTLLLLTHQNQPSSPHEKTTSLVPNIQPQVFLESNPF